MLWLSLFCINTFLLEESIEMEFVVDGHIYLGGNGLTMMDDMHPMVEWCVVRIQ